LTRIQKERRNQGYDWSSLNDLTLSGVYNRLSVQDLGGFFVSLEISKSGRLTTLDSTAKALQEPAKS
jgi:hypothetical protein